MAKKRGKRPGLKARSKNARKPKKAARTRKLEKVTPLPGTAVELQTAKAEGQSPKAQPWDELDEKFRCPNCDSLNLMSKMENIEFPYGLAPDTVNLQALIVTHTCQACGTKFSDMTAEQAQLVAVDDYLRLKARGLA